MISLLWISKSPYSQYGDAKRIRPCLNSRDGARFRITTHGIVYAAICS